MRRTPKTENVFVLRVQCEAHAFLQSSYGLQIGVFQPQPSPLLPPLNPYFSCPPNGPCSMTVDYQCSEMPGLEPRMVKPEL